MKSLVVGALVLGTLVAAAPTPSEARDGCGPGRWFNGYRCVGRHYAPPPQVFGFYGPRYDAPRYYAPPRHHWRDRDRGHWRRY